MHPAVSHASAGRAVARNRRTSTLRPGAVLAALTLVAATVASAAPTWTPDLESFNRARGAAAASRAGTPASGVVAATPTSAPRALREGERTVAPEKVVTPAGWTYESNLAAAHLGTAVGTAGDVNGDGFSDVAALAEAGSSMALYVFHGTAAGLVLAPGFPITPLPGAGAGCSVFSAGDVNNDGFGDVAVGLERNSGGTLRVYYGSATGLATTGYFETSSVSANFARVVRPAGDVNGDGFDDLLVGSPGVPPSLSICGSGPSPTGIVEVYYGSASGMNAANRQVALGCQWAVAGSGFGQAISTAGDVNADGFDDIVIGAFGAGPPLSPRGGAWVAYGSPTGLPIFASTSNLIDLSLGTRLEGYNLYSGFGTAVSAAGDVDGDGYADIAVGAPNEDSYGVDGGLVWVFAGGPAGVDTTRKLWWEASSFNGALFGQSLAPAGDHNADGRPDLLVGQSGQTNVATGLAPALLGGSYLLMTQFLPYDPQSQWCETAGDVNGDGFSDLVVGESFHSNGELAEGRLLVHFGAGGTPSPYPGWQVTTSLVDPNLGWSVASIGDVNGDGYDDIAVGAPTWDDFSGGGSNQGLVLVYHGGVNGPSPSIYDWFYYGAPDDQAGISIAAAGDVNGDGYGDVIVGAHQPGVGNGQALVWYGGPMGLGFSPNIVLTGATFDSHFGSSVAGAGDVDGDGFADVIVGAPLDEDPSVLPAPINNEGRAWLYRGGAGGLSSSPAWSDRGGQVDMHFGSGVASVGDANGDGRSDVVVAAPDYDVPVGRLFIVDCGRLVVYLGQDTGPPVATQTVIQGPSNGRLGGSVAGAGDVDGDGYSDLIAGAPNLNGPQTAEGWVVVYPGSPAGIVSSALWSTFGGEAFGGFGSAVSSAGDVNGDGLGDVLVGGVFQDLGGAQDRGHAAVYLGPLPPGAAAAWNAYGPSSFANMGHCVANAGDVDGDGWNELLLGMPGFTSSFTRQGLAQLHLGAEASALKQRALAFRPVSGGLVQPLDLTDAGFLGLGLTGRSAAGRTRVRLEWRLRPAVGLPVATLTGIGATQPTGTPGPYGSITGLLTYETRLKDGIAYAWQMRSRSRSPYFPTSAWLSPARSSAREWDLRAPGTSVDAPGRIAGLEAALIGPRPNPMEASSILAFRLSRDGDASLRVVDVQGRRVRELTSGARAAGLHQIRWDGRDDRGQAVAAGLYFVHLEAEGARTARRLVVVR